MFVEPIRNVPLRQSDIRLDNVQPQSPDVQPHEGGGVVAKRRIAADVPLTCEKKAAATHELLFDTVGSEFR